MAIDPYMKDYYKLIRKRCWSVLAVLWLGYWYLYLVEQKREAVEQMSRCKSVGGIKAAACSSVDFFLPSDVMGNANILLGLFMALVFSPILFWPAGYLARIYLFVGQWWYDRQESAQQVALQLRHEDESRRSRAENEAEMSSVLTQISRSEVINKLGTIHDLTDLLHSEADEERRMNIRHGVAQSLRELAAKYTPAQLGELIKSDEVVAHTAQEVLRRLDGSPLGSIVEIQALRIAAQ